MPRMKQKEIATAAPTSLVASAARIRSGAGMGLTVRNTTADWWHSEAWNYYHIIGEFRYACDWIGGMLSKAVLYATQETADGVVAVKEGSITEYIGGLFKNADGRAEMLRMVGIHLSVTGECFLVGHADTEEFSDGGDAWQVAASTKCVAPATKTGHWVVNDKEINIPGDQVNVIRIWRPDPLNPELSISPARAILSSLKELHKLSQHVSAQVDSRLAGAGLLLMPNTMTFPPPPKQFDENGEEIPQLHKTANNAEDLMVIIQEAMAKSLRNRDDASALVPIIVTASPEAIEAVKHLTFWSDLDEHAIELRTEAIRRIALGMDVPPEVLQGAAEANHWSAWQADESAIKAHAEPLLKLITTAIGKEYLRPLIKEDPAYKGQRLSSFSVAADTSEMRLRPNRSKEALELHDRGVLSDAALVRETGFDDTDMMDDDARKMWLLRKLAQGSTTPEFAEAAASALGVDLQIPRPAAGSDGEPARPTPSLQDHPENNIPDQETSGRRKQARQEGRVPSSDVERKAALLAASEQLVMRALERAGNRLKNKMGGLKVNCSAGELYLFAQHEDPEALLEDAWTGVPMVAHRAGIHPDSLELALAAYTGDLIQNQRKHTYQEMSRYMGLRVDLNGVEAA